MKIFKRFWRKQYQNNYQAYLHSRRWKIRRELVLMRDRYRCVLCNSAGNGRPLEIHHRTYDQVFAERLSDLYTLCRDCHENMTFATRNPKGKTL